MRLREQGFLAPESRGRGRGILTVWNERDAAEARLLGTMIRAGIVQRHLLAQALEQHRANGGQGGRLHVAVPGDERVVEIAVRTA